jgi:hypothetical protein
MLVIFGDSNFCIPAAKVRCQDCADFPSAGLANPQDERGRTLGSSGQSLLSTFKPTTLEKTPLHICSPARLPVAQLPLRPQPFERRVLSNGFH